MSGEDISDCRLRDWRTCRPSYASQYDVRVDEEGNEPDPSPTITLNPFEGTPSMIKKAQAGPAHQFNQLNGCCLSREDYTPGGSNLELIGPRQVRSFLPNRVQTTSTDFCDM